MFSNPLMSLMRKVLIGVAKIIRETAEINVFIVFLKNLGPQKLLLFHQFCARTKQSFSVIDHLFNNFPASFNFSDSSRAGTA